MTKEKRMYQIFALKSVEEIADFMAAAKFDDIETRDTLLLKIAFLLEDIRDSLRRR